MLTQKIITDNIKTLHTNNLNYITIGLNTSEYINIYIYEQLISFLNQKQSLDTVIYSTYSLYNNNGIILHLNENGSSNCYNKILKYTNSYESTGYNIKFYSYFNKKLINDSFESSYTYDNIDIVECLLYTYNGINIELLKINNNYSVRILIKPDNSSSSIYNIINIIMNITV